MYHSNGTLNRRFLQGTPFEAILALLEGQDDDSLRIPYLYPARRKIPNLRTRSKSRFPHSPRFEMVRILVLCRRPNVANILLQ